MSTPRQKGAASRRDFLRDGLKTTAAIGIGTTAGLLLTRAAGASMVWQIDPTKCVQCERCSTNCVLGPSAVKCVHSFDMCGYCLLCGGYYEPTARTRDTAAENQLCPAGALKRTFVETPFYEYTIDESLCIGCGKCVKGCNAFGNGSLQLQVRYDLCVQCNQCSIAVLCPSDAFVRVPASSPYLVKGRPASAGPEKAV